MLRVTDNIRQVKRTLKSWQRKQIPFAASLALNDVAFDTKDHIVRRIWPNSFPQARNQRFPRALFRVRKASKRRLRAEVFDSLDRRLLDLLIEGGRRRPFQSSAIAVPQEGIKRTATGKIPRNKRPENLSNAFEADFGRGPAIWQRHGRGGSKLRMMYVLAPSTMQRAQFPFYTSGIRFAATRWDRAFRKAIARALRTAR